MSLKIIKVYSVDYNKTGMFTNVTGFSSHEKYGECGTFTLSLGFQTDDTFLKIGTIINVEDFYGIVEKVTVNNNGYTLNGYTLEHMLYNRCHYKYYKYTCPKDICEAYEENRRDSKVLISTESSELLEKPFSKPYEYDGGNFYNELLEICKAEGLGVKSRILQYGGEVGLAVGLSIYKGEDLSISTSEDCVFFSPDRKNMKDAEIKVDFANKKDVCYVRGKCIDGSYLIVRVGANESPSTREMYLDKTSEEQRQASETKDENSNVVYRTPEETLADYKIRLYNFGVDALNSSRVVESATMSVVATGYGEKYRLGDLVRCQDKKIGLDVVMTVKQYDIEIDRNGDNRYVRLGDSKAVGE